MPLVKHAYELGCATQMVRRGMVYLWRFAAFDDYRLYTEDMPGEIRWWAARGSEAVEHLVHHADIEEPQKIHVAWKQVRRVAQKLIERHRRGDDWEGRPYGHGPCPGGDEWRTLYSRSALALDREPVLRRWQQLGASVGSCTREATAPKFALNNADISEIVLAAQNMSDSARQRIPLLGRCAAQSPAAAQDDPVVTLETILNTDVNERPAHSSLKAARYPDLLRRLDQNIRQGIATSLPMSDLHLDDSDLNHCQVVLEGRSYSVNHEQLLILRSLINANGETRSGEAIRREHGVSLQGTRIDRQVSGLHQSLSELIERMPGHGGGYRLPLD